MNSPVRSLDDLALWMKQTLTRRKAQQRPLVLVSYAQSIDGSIATRARAQVRLSGRSSMTLTHGLRALCDAILVGIGTVLADNPRLNVRLADGRSPQPIILDTRLRTPVDARLVRRTDRSCWIVSGLGSPPPHEQALDAAGATVLRCATTAEGKVDLEALMRLLSRHQVGSVMVEGGAEIITSFINSRLVDLFVITIAPKLIGGLPIIDRRGLTCGPPLQLNHTAYQQLGDDLIVWARPQWKPA